MFVVGVGRSRSLAVLGLGLAGGGMRPLAAQTVVAGPVTAQVATAVGDQITVPVKADMTAAGGRKLGAYTVRFGWDATVLRYVGSSSGSFASAVFNTDSAASGVVRFAGANAAGATGVVTLGSLTLEILSTAKTSPITTTFSELTAAGTFQDLLPLLSVTPLTFCPGRFMGDLDHSRQIQALDAQIVLMHSVGLAVADTSAGDVDGSTKVDPRDALIILSYVVGLDTSPFLVGKFSSGLACTFGVPKSVTLSPDPVTLAAGDVLKADAEVRDSTGSLLGGLNLAWSSSNTAVARVDATGAVTALAVGTAVIRVSAAPGITDSASVTVGERHRWVVNPVVAQTKTSELGSDLYPFSTIRQAIDSAAVDDTVFIHVATYHEPLTTTKRLVFKGDSGAAGMPVISVPSGPAGQLTVSGRQVVQRLEFAESQRGLVVRADTIGMLSVRFRAIRGRALEVPKATFVALGAVTVDGAVGEAVFLDSTHVVLLAGMQVQGVGGALSTIVPEVSAVGIFVRADSLVVVDTSRIQGVDGQGIHVFDAERLWVNRTLITDANSGIGADSTLTTLDVTGGSVFRRLGNGIFAEGTDTVRVERASFDTTYTGVWAYKVGRVSVADGAFRYAQYGVYADSGLVADVRRSTFAQTNYGMWLGQTERVTIDSTNVDLASRAAFVARAAVAAVDRSEFVNVFTGVSTFIDSSLTPSYLTSADLTVRNSDRGFAVGADSVLVRRATLRHLSTIGYTQPFIKTATLTSPIAQWTRIEGGRISNVDYHGIVVDSARRVEVVGVEVDSTYKDAAGCSTCYGVTIRRSQAVRVDSSNIHDNFAGAVYVYRSAPFMARQNVIARSHVSATDPNGLTGRTALRIEDVSSADIRGNTFTNNAAAGIYTSYFGGVDGATVVESNTFRGRYWGVRAWGPDTLKGHVEVRNNGFVGTLTDSLFTRQVGMGPVRTMIVENNTLDSAFGQGIAVAPGDSIIVRGNVITRQQDYDGIDAFRGRVAVFENNNVACADSNFAIGILYSAGSGSIVNNTVSKCYWGAYSYNGLAGSGVFFDLAIRGNTFTRDGALYAPNLGYHVGGGRYRVEMVGNTATGGAYNPGSGGLAVVGDWYAMRSARVDSNTVQSGTGYGIRALWVDTLRVRGNTVSGMSDDATITWPSALELGPIYVSGTVDSNAFAGNGVTGVFLRGGTSAGVVSLTRNLIADDTVSGGILLHSPATGSLNSIRRNRPFGLSDSSGVGGSVFQQNNFEGNAFAVFNAASGALNATNSWWGDTLGPRCASGCNPASTGDSISANVLFSPVATAPVAGAPAGTPPALVAVVSRSAEVGSAQAGTSVRLPAGVRIGPAGFPEPDGLSGGGGAGSPEVSSAAVGMAGARGPAGMTAAPPDDLLAAPPKRPERKP